MAGRFSFSVPERRNASDPWFRIGTLDVGTTGFLVILLSVASMVLWAIGGNEIDSVWGHLVLIPDEVSQWPDLEGRHLAARQRTGHLGGSSPSPSSGTSAGRSKACSGAPTSPSCCCC